MKQLLTIFLTLFSIYSYSQKTQLNGIYITGDLSDTLRITDGSLKFKYENVYGFGPYKIKKDIIKAQTIINTDNISSNYRIEDSINSKNKIKVSVINPESIIYSSWTTFVSVEHNEGRKTYISLIIEDSIPVLVQNFNSNKPENKILLVTNRNDKLKIPLKDILGKSIKVYLTDKYMLMDEEVSFKIIINKNDTLIKGPFPKLTRMDKRMYGMNHTWPWKKRLKCNHELIPNEYIKQ